MKHLLFTALLAAAVTSTFAADVGVSVNIGQPGFYGRLDIGDFPQPQVLYRQPVLVGRGGADREPIYMRVPPRHAQNWRRYCGRYNACDERVYFVRDRWYRHEYAPRYQERYRDGHRGWDRDGHDRGQYR